MTRTTEPAERSRGEETVGRAVGRPLDRVDGKAKTTGAALFVAEFAYPDLATQRWCTPLWPAERSPTSTPLPRQRYRA